MRALITAAAFTLCSMSARAQTLTARVVSVADGDTISVSTEGKRRVTIRLQGIDAPERTMPYSQISRRHLSELVMGKVVTFDPEKVDRHGRTVAVVRLQNGIDVSLAQINASLAWHFKRYESEQTPEDRSAYGAAEVIARPTQRGLWRDPKPVAPWDFRARLRAQETEQP